MTHEPAKGLWLLVQRRKLGLTQAQLGAALGYGVLSIGQMERGQTLIRPATVMAVQAMVAALPGNGLDMASR